MGIMRGYIGLRGLPGHFCTTVDYERLRLRLNPYSLGMLAYRHGSGSEKRPRVSYRVQAFSKCGNFGKSLHEAAYCLLR